MKEGAINELIIGLGVSQQSKVPSLKVARPKRNQQKKLAAQNTRRGA